MKIYLVGGAVRDKLLGLPVKERDWVVVGATAKDMLQKGFRQVGKDFPVFLHPVTHEEYALARKERKVGLGYKGFTFDASTDVTLEDDLIRRDLTINAMAESEAGQLIDPYQGQHDLAKKILRHVSPAFVEDPVRILRVARFAARFGDFTVAPETNALMQNMVKLGEVDALVPERVWKELERALGEAYPTHFFQVLADCDALPVLFPEIHITDSRMIADSDTQIRFAVLMHHLSEAQIESIAVRYRIPTDYRDVALLTAACFSKYHKVKTLSAEQIVTVLQRLDAFRREERFKKIIKACAIASGEDFVALWLSYLQAAKQVDMSSLLKEVSGKDIPAKVHQARVEQIEQLLK